MQPIQTYLQVGLEKKAFHNMRKKYVWEHKLDGVCWGKKRPPTTSTVTQATSKQFEKRGYGENHIDISSRDTRDNSHGPWYTELELCKYILSSAEH